MTRLTFYALTVLSLAVLVTSLGCKKKPSISLIGDNPMSVTLNTAFADPGATASDGSSVSTSGAVNANLKGTYTVTYSAGDGSATRTVNVVNSVDFLQGKYHVHDTSTVNGNSYDATLTPSSTVNNNLNINNFGGLGIDSSNVPLSYNSSGETFTAVNPVKVGYGRKIILISPSKINSFSPINMTMTYTLIPGGVTYTSTYTK